MNFNKLLKNLNMSQVVMILGVLVLGYALLNYSNHKGNIQDGMRDSNNYSNGNNHQDIPREIMHPPKSPSTDTCIDTTGSPQPNMTSLISSEPSSVNNLRTSNEGMAPSCERQQVTDPAELLPRDENSEWSRLNPMGAGDLQNVNLLKAGYHIGINTVASTLRNANLQVRSEPPNPQLNVGPWNQTTIEPDINRRPLEIGSC